MARLPMYLMSQSDRDRLDGWIYYPARVHGPLTARQWVQYPAQRAESTFGPQLTNTAPLGEWARQSLANLLARKDWPTVQEIADTMRQDARSSNFTVRVTY